MLDRDGDEHYQPMLVPLAGGDPAPAFGTALAADRVHCVQPDHAWNLVYSDVESRSEPMRFAYRGDLTTGRLERMSASRWGIGGGRRERRPYEAVLSTPRRSAITCSNCGAPMTRAPAALRRAT